MKDRLITEFEAVFGAGGNIIACFAPGRVNLIGEHTDYNGGHVFPCALTLGTYLIARKRTDDRLRFYSANFSEKGILESQVNAIAPTGDDSWINYPLGVMWAFEQKGHPLESGYDLYYYGNIPNGAGLSSSASIEVVTGVMLNETLAGGFTNEELAIIGQYSENNFNGVNCGIMDQFAVAMGRAGCAIYLDTNSLEYEYAPLNLDGYKIVIGNTNKRRGLNDSKYNERRAECESALKSLKASVPINSLCELTTDSFKKMRNKIGDATLVARARHVISENERCAKAVIALGNEDLYTFGGLMNQSHLSLKLDYEVTGTELDTLVEEAWQIPGAIGSRMTGAGFGGCTVSIVRDDAVSRFIETVGEKYLQKIGYPADFYVVEAGDGARVI